MFLIKSAFVGKKDLRLSKYTVKQQLKLNASFSVSNSMTMGQNEN